MIRRLSLILVTLAAVCFTAGARLTPGSWQQFPVFGTFTDLIDTKSAVYYVTGGSLYSYDKQADETRHYEYGQDLSDFSIERIFYNFDDNYLLVTFANGNMDLIYPDGRKVNLPDIKDSTIDWSKKINDVKFYDGKIYIATAFGIVIYNGSTHEVKESGIYGRPVQCLAVDDTRILLIMGDNVDGYSEIYSAAHGDRINKLDNFSRIGKATSGSVESMDAFPPGDERSGRFYPVIQWKTVRRLDATTGGIVNSEIRTTRLSRNSEGLCFFSETTPIQYCDYDQNAMGRSIATLPSVMSGSMMSTWDGLQSLWAGSSDGLGHYSVSGTDVTVLRDKSIPSDAISMTNICRIYPTADGSGFYTANIGQSHTHPIGTGDRYTEPMEACLMLDDDTFTPFHPVTAGGETVIAPTAIVEDPDDPSIVYVASTSRGIYVFRDGEQIALIDESNSPITKMDSWLLSPTSLSFDKDGNFWVGYVTLSSAHTTVMMLPAAKRKAGIASVGKEDWLQPDFGSFLTFKDVTLLPCTQSDIVLAYDGTAYHGFMAYYHGGNPTNLSGSARMEWSRLTDQDGKDFSPEFILSMVEDQNGQVWVGTTSGVISIPNPLRTMSSDFTINRVKVPRNDGTNLADYLLESDRVSAVAVDNSNRKWFGTESSGLFLTNATGSEILASYNTSNSPLPTNCITAIYPDPYSGSIFVGTMAGLLEFASASGPARPDYSDVYAYPNPVTPDFSGLITIEGLMANSLIKIVDAGFNTVCQIYSEGGMAQWDGCNMNGQRVRSGVYYVVASTSTDTSSSGDVVTKILVIN